MDLGPLSHRQILSLKTTIFKSRIFGFLFMKSINGKNLPEKNSGQRTIYIKDPSKTEETFFAQIIIVLFPSHSVFYVCKICFDVNCELLEKTKQKNISFIRVDLHYY